ncbi:MAG: DUF3488 and transglutaminase-like domain-containing protein [Oceanospirillaceae bacterium]
MVITKTHSLAQKNMATETLLIKHILLLMLAQCAALLPLLEQLPWWMLLLCLTLFFTRIQIVKRKILPINQYIKFSLVLVTVSLLLISSDSGYSLHSFVVLLVLTMCLKIIELTSKRDYILMVFLGCFISASQLLFANSLIAFFYVIFCLLLLHVCLLQLCCEPHKPLLNATVSIQQQSINQWRYIKKLLLLFLQALPIAVVFFLVIPKIGSLWQVPLHSKAAKTGMTDSLSAGDIAKLNQDNSAAMRITFDNVGKIDNAQLYWRGLVLEDFDGKTWRRSAQRLAPISAAKTSEITSTNSRINYQVMLENTDQPWLYALNTATTSNSKIAQWQNYSLTKRENLQNRFQYNVQSYPDYVDSSDLSALEYQKLTALPKNENPKTRQYAVALAQKFSDKQQIIDAIMQKFNEQFTYTLAPGRMSTTHGIDDFLFAKKRGYCEHFASTTAFILRAAGIPSRIAAGYQGGQWSSDNRYLLVTQAAAHAWVEVWLAGKGWVRLDPTAAVAPQRIESGASDYLAQLTQGSSLVSSLSQTSLMRQLRLRWDNVNYQWHRWVLGYDNKLQLALVTRFLGGIDAWRIGLLLLSVLSLMLIPLFIKRVIGLPKKKESDVIVRLRKLDKVLAKIDLAREKGETLNAFLQRAAEHSSINKPALMAIAATANQLLYDTDAGRSACLHQLDTLIEQVKNSR